MTEMDRKSPRPWLDSLLSRMIPSLEYVLKYSSMLVLVADSAIGFRCTNDIPVKEATLMSVLVMTFSQYFPVLFSSQ